MDMVFLTRFAVIITAESTKKAPKLAAIAIAQLENAIDKKTPPKRLEPKINIATPKLAPDEIPKTKGPASGFLNNVCINKPQIDKPEPTKIAVIAFGNLKFKMIVCQLSLAGFPPDKLFKISSNGIETDPKLIFTKKNTNSKTANKIKYFVCFCCFILSFLRKQESILSLFGFLPAQE